MSELGVGWAGGALVLVAGIVTSVLLGRRARTHAASARDAADLEARPPALARGRITLRGTVRTDDERAAVRVRVHQSGTEWRGKHGWHHTWAETKRESVVRSFWLDLPGDPGSIWVDASGGLVLADDLDVVSRVALDRRVRKARLRHGESVSVTGELSRGRWPNAESGGEGYREAAPEGWVLSCGAGDLLSTQHLADTGRRWARVHLRSIALVFLAVAVVEAFWYVSFGAYAIGGARCTATVVERSAHREPIRVDGRWIDPYAIGETGPECVEPGRRVVVTLEPEEWIEWREGDWFDVWLTVGSPFFSFDPPRLDGGFVVLAVATVLVVAVIIRNFRRQARRWWDGVAVVDRGKGRLAESEPRYEPDDEGDAA